MIDLHWSSSYVGIPYADRGRTRDGADCGGLACLVYREKLGIELKSYDDWYSSTDAQGEVAGVLADAAARPEWSKVEGRHLPFDMLVFRAGRYDSHVGINVKPGMMLHMAEEEQARLERYADPRWARRLVGVYRHRDAGKAEIEAPVRSDSVTVAAGPAMTRDGRRPALSLPPGRTLAEIVAVALPGALPDQLARASIVLVTDRGEMPVDRSLWDKVRPRLGVLVDIRFAPAKDGLKSLLGIVVAIAAIAISTYLAPFLVTNVGLFGQQTWQALLGLGVMTIGTIAINALVPPPATPTTQEPKPLHQISSWRNPVAPDGVVPSVMGRQRYAPPFAFAPYTEIRNGKQFVCAVFNFGYGKLELSDHRIGETPIEKFENYKMQVRDGGSGNAPLSMFPRQVLEDAVGAELLHNKAIVRTMALDSSRGSIILMFPTGLAKVTDKGKLNNRAVQVRVRSREVGTSPWTFEKTLTIRDSTRDPFYVQRTWPFGGRGLYEVEVVRLSDDADDPSQLDRVQFVALQSMRNEYWNNFDSALCLVGLRIKASSQLTGALDSYNAVAERVCLDWDKDDEEWVVRGTSNPASLTREVMQGPQNAKRLGNGKIDLEALQAWHEYCLTNGLRYDRVHDFEASFEETLVTIAAAGRASPRFDGAKWTWVVDRPKTEVVDEFNARNSRSFRWEKAYGEPPHAVRVPFLDRSNDYASAERIVPFPGHSGDITLFEQMDIPGKVLAAEVYREARRRMYEALYRTTSYQLTVDGVTRPATRGDLVRVNYDVLQRMTKAARVVDVIGNTVILDDTVEMEDGETFAMRWRWFSGPDDAIGESVVRPVLTVAGETSAVTLGDGTRAPEAGMLVSFGPIATESLPLIVKSIERGEDMSSIYTLIAPADAIDDALDRDEIPEWSGRVGGELDGLTDEPQAPEITRVLTGRAGTGDKNNILVYVVENEDEDVRIDRFRIFHRLFGAGSWSGPKVMDAGDVAAEITGYSDGDVVQLQAYAVSVDNTEGLASAIVTVTIGADDGDIPDDLPVSIDVTGGLGWALIEGATSSDEATAQIAIYRNRSDDPGDLDRDADLVGTILVVPDKAYRFTDGDPSRKNLIWRADFSSGRGWTKGAGWSVGDGVASHAAGTLSQISRPAALMNNRWYRIKYDVEDRTDGGIVPRLIGGSAPVGGTVVSANGQMILDRVHNDAGADNDTFAFMADADFDGSVDDVVVYQETLACIGQGEWFYFLEPQNGAGRPGNLAGPFSVIII